MSLSASETRKEAVKKLWHIGHLQWKLHDVQKKMAKAYFDQNTEITVIACSRRLGKSYLLCLLAIEQCLKYPNSIVKYVCPKKNMVKTILQPIIKDITKDCPAELKPEYKINEYMYVFPNGSQIQMAGTDNGHHETLRGGRSELWIVDEAGFCDELSYVVKTILAPTADTTGGRGILASTPSKTSDHDFIVDFLLPTLDKNQLIKYTIYDNPLITKEKLATIINRYPLKEKDPEFRREYLCEVINNSDLAIVPEFTKELEEKVVKEWERPPFYDSYVSMDIGGKDLTVVLFGYYDFLNAKLVIEDELVFGKSIENKSVPEFRIDHFAQAVDKKEKQLWSHPLSGEFKPPYLRVSDNNNVIFLSDLAYKYNLVFTPTRKDNKEAVLNTMRVMIADERIIINPRCKTLIRHLRNGTWAKNKKDFSRSVENGHWDGVAALMYMVRNIQEAKNPYPPGYASNREQFFKGHMGNKDYTSKEAAWVQIFKQRKSLGK